MPDNIVQVPSDPTGPDAPESRKDDGGELILGKFKSQDDLARAYQELEKKMGGKPTDDDDGGDSADPKDDKTPPQDDPKPDDKPKDIPEKLTYDDAAEALKQSGLDIKDFSKELEANGELTAESYEKLAKAGFPRQLVDKFVGDMSAQQAANQVLADAQVKEIKGMVGGDEQYDQMVRWAAQNLSQEEQEAYDSIMATNNPAQIKMAVQALQYRFTKEFGSDPTFVRGDAKGSVKDTFRSHHEVVQAMRDKRYGKDPAYTREVEEKVARSDVF